MSSEKLKRDEKILLVLLVAYLFCFWLQVTFAFTASLHLAVLNSVIILGVVIAAVYYATKTDPNSKRITIGEIITTLLAWIIPNGIALIIYRVLL